MKHFGVVTDSQIIGHAEDKNTTLCCISFSEKEKKIFGKPDTSCQSYEAFFSGYCQPKSSGLQGANTLAYSTSAFVIKQKHFLTPNTARQSYETFLSFN